jgi:hypothetical protein
VKNLALLGKHSYKITRPPVITLRPTLELAKAIKLENLPALPPSEHPLTDWCVRGFRVRRNTYLIFTDMLSLYSLIVTRRGATTAAKLRRIFATAVHENFNHPTLGDSPASDILKSMANCQFSRCQDRRVLGSINDLVGGAQWHLEYGKAINETTQIINTTPLGHLKMNNPNRELAQLLAGQSDPSD